MPEATSLRIKPAAARLVLQGDAEVRRLAAAVWGMPFSEESCRAFTLASRSTLWLGPDEHLLFQESRDPALPIEELEQAIGERPHSLVDVSHRQVAIEISGPNAALILNGACPLDLDLREFPVQMCTRTVLAKAEIVLWRTAPQVFHLEVWRSFQSYALGLLHEIARPYSVASLAP
jgi:sarcosine oxidase, subunit gamma